MKNPPSFSNFSKSINFPLRKANPPYFLVKITYEVSIMVWTNYKCYDVKRPCNLCKMCSPDVGFGGTYIEKAGQVSFNNLTDV